MAQEARTNPAGLLKRTVSLVLPIFLDIETPFPLEVDVFIIVGKEAVHGVGSSGHHAWWSVFWRRGVWLDLGLWRVRTDHVGHFVNWNGRYVLDFCDICSTGLVLWLYTIGVNKQPVRTGEGSFLSSRGHQKKISIIIKHQFFERRKYGRYLKRKYDVLPAYHATQRWHFI